jgi:hypothetical protein
MGVAARPIIDIVAVVKEALRDATVRDQIREIVLEFAPVPANDIEDLLDGRATAAFLGMTPGALRMAVFRGTIRTVKESRERCDSTRGGGALRRERGGRTEARRGPVPRRFLKTAVQHR